MAVPYETKGGSGLLVRDDVASSSAWHSKVSVCLALGRVHPPSAICGQEIADRSNRAENGDLASVVEWFEA